jgi:N-acetylglucosamine-6-sulfatase
VVPLSRYLSQPGFFPAKFFRGKRIVRKFKSAGLVFFGVGLLFIGMQAAQAQTPSSPNMLVVLVDDMRWDDYAAGGHPFVQTPNIDRLAAEGVRFDNAFATTPLCSPSRASLLTGLYVRNHGIVDNTQRGGYELDTFPLLLDQAGYDTGFVGKWHMGSDGRPRPGFDTWVGMLGQGTNFDPKLFVGQKEVETTGHVTDVLTDYAVDFLQQPRQQPFLLYFAQKAVHPDPAVGLTDGGFLAADRHVGLYDQEPIFRSPSAGVPPVDKPGLMRPVEGLPPLGFDTVTTDATIRQRLEMVTGVDESLGRLLQALEDTGQLDNTVVVLISDHGYFYGEHGLNPQRRLAYEESIRIPFLVRYPPLVEAGSEIEEMVLTVDMAPTLLELAGLSSDTDGESLVPLLEGDYDEWRESFLVEYFSGPPGYMDRLRGEDGLIPIQVREFGRILGMGYDAVRTERYKYIKYRTLENSDELYDLTKDPYELRNLINEPSMSAILEGLQGELARLSRELER